MVGIKSMLGTIERISPDKHNEHYFMGYYDLPLVSMDNAYVLAHKVSFMNALPRPDDICELGRIHRESKRFEPIATTSAWNFQQGAMFQYYSQINKKDSVVFYNDWDGEDYISYLHEIESGNKRKIDFPLATLSPDGKYGLSINFNRVYDFRAGYGYNHRRDPFYEQSAPVDDGVILVDLNTGQSKQIISYKNLNELYSIPAGRDNSKIVINHITFNPASNRFLFLVRYFPEENGMWGTGLGTCDLAGNIYLLRPFTYASHYIWKNESTILLYGDCGQGDGLYEMKDLTQEATLVNAAFFKEDIHCSYTPDQQWILGDGYAYDTMYRKNFLYHIEKEIGTPIGEFYSPDLPSFDIRSDLHTKIDKTGTRIFMDSIHEGYRGIYEMDLSGILRFISSAKK